MDIKLGKLRLGLSALALYDGATDRVVDWYVKTLVSPRRFYRWDCSVPAGKPDPRPETRRRATSLLVHVGDGRGGVDVVKRQQVTRDLLRSADLPNLKKLDAALQKQLPPLVVPVDWAMLLDPFKQEYSVDIYEQVTYLQCLARPYGMQPDTYFHIFVPQMVSFSARVVGRCGGALKDGTVLTGMSSAVMLSGNPAKLERQVSKEEEEAEAHRKREEERRKEEEREALEKLMPPKPRRRLPSGEEGRPGWPDPIDLDLPPEKDGMQSGKKKRTMEDPLAGEKKAPGKKD